MHSLPQHQLPHFQKQENFKEQVGNGKTLQTLPQAHSSQRNQIKKEAIGLFFYSFPPEADPPLAENNYHFRRRTDPALRGDH